MRKILAALCLLCSVSTLLNADNSLNNITSFTFHNNRIYLGTPQGLFYLEKDGNIDSVSIFSKFVTSLTSSNNKLFIGTDNGLYYYDGSAVTSISLGSSSSEYFVYTTLQYGSKVYAGTSSGLFEIRADGSTRKIHLPDNEEEVIAIGIDNKGLLVSVPRKLYRYYFEDTFALILERNTYKSIFSSNSGFWLGLRADGTVDICDERPFAMTVKLELPFGGDFVTAIHLSDSDKLLFGTMRGRILTADAREGYRRVGWNEVYSTRNSIYPIRNINTRGDKIYCGTEGGGLMIITPGSDKIEWASSSKREAPPELKEEEVKQKTDQMISVLPLTFIEHIKKLWYLVIAVFVIVSASVVIILTLKRNRENVRFKEKRRTTRTKDKLPPINDLSNDIAEYSIRLKKITQKINELTKRSVTNKGESFKEDTSSAMAEFEDVERWMKERYEQIKNERSEKIQRLSELKKIIKSSSDSSSAIIEGEVREIENWLKQIEIDERYLKYVLEL